MKKSLEEMTRKDYDKLMSTGMLWELYPQATGDYTKDCWPEASIKLYVEKDKNA